MNRLALTLSAVLWGVTVVGCGTDDDASSSSEANSSISSSVSSESSSSVISSASSSSVSSVAFEIFSMEFAQNDPLPAAHSCDGKGFGEGVSPELHWTDGPEGTESYAIVFTDYTLTEQGSALGYHWMIWNIPSDIHLLPNALPGDRSPAAMGGAEQSRGPTSNDNSYFGPCPSYQCNAERENHTYKFTLYAMGTNPVSPGSDLANAQAYFEQNALAKTELTVTSDAKPTQCFDF